MGDFSPEKWETEKVKSFHSVYILMIDYLTEILRDIIAGSERGRAVGADISSHVLGATLLNNSFDELKLTTKSKIKNTLIKASGYFASMSADLDHPFGSFLHEWPACVVHDFLLSASLSLSYRGWKKRGKAFLSYLALTSSHRAIDYFQLYGAEFGDFYKTIFNNSVAISAALTGAIGVYWIGKRLMHRSKSMAKSYSSTQEL
jgi:hypothetical protein